MGRDQCKRSFSLFIGMSLAVLLLLLFSIALPQDKSSSPLSSLSPRTGLLLKDEVTIKLIHNSSGDLAHDYVSQLAQWDRSQVTEGFARAAEWMSQKAKEFGLEQVNIERFPSDGKTEYFGNPTQRLWKVKKGELWMKSPFEMRITSYAELPMSLARNSTTGEVEADLIDVGAGMDESDYRQDVKGKIVLTSSRPGFIFQRSVIEKGALGIVSSWSVPEWDFLNRQPGDFPDQVGWTGIPESEEKRSNNFAFMISSRRAQELKILMHRGIAVRLRAIVDAELVPGTLDVVSGVIPGSKYPNEEIVVTAHLDHYKPGGNDNASGSSSSLEIARTLRYLIETKQLPPPLRTIRFLWVPEYNGTWAWLSKHQDDPVKRVANLNFDMLGEDLMKTNAVFAISYTPDSNPSFLNAVMESILDFLNKYNDERYPPQKDFQVVSVKGSRNRLQGRMVPFTVGTDHELFNNLKIPGTGPLGWPDYYYHSSEDTPDKVDPTQLHRVIVTGLTALTTLVYADDENAEALARLSFLYGRKRISVSEFAAAQSLLKASAKDFFESELLATTLLRHVYQREREAIRSAATFARKDGTRKTIEKTASLLDDDEIASIKNSENIAAARARDLGLGRESRVLTDAERRAARLTPSREKGKDLFNAAYVMRHFIKDSTANIPRISAAINETNARLSAQGESDLRLMGLADAPAYYADGKRSILDIHDAFAVDYGPMSLEALVLYFRAYEKAGLMKLTEK